MCTPLSMDQQTRYSIWTGRKFRGRSHIMASSFTDRRSFSGGCSTVSHSTAGSWEERAFADDSSGRLGGGCVWPPRSYACSFCRREFRSAQALGGHMNVHRRDRARLKQSPPSSSTTLQEDSNVTSLLRNPRSPITACTHNPRLSFFASPFPPAASSTRIVSTMGASNSDSISASTSMIQGNIRKRRSILPYAHTVHPVPEGSNLKMGKNICCDQERNTEEIIRSGEDMIMSIIKKQGSGDAEATYCLLREDLGGDRHRLRSEGFVGDHNYYPVKELDLELRLGDRS